MKKKKTIKNILAHTVLTLLAIVWVSPLVWIILTSFRAQKGAYTSSFFPKSYSLDNTKNVDIIQENTATINVLVNIRGKLSIPVSVNNLI